MVEDISPAAFRGHWNLFDKDPYSTLLSCENIPCNIYSK